MEFVFCSKAWSPGVARVRGKGRAVREEGRAPGGSGGRGCLRRTHEGPASGQRKAGGPLGGALMRALPAGCCTVASTGCAYVFSSFLREACEQKPPCSWRRMLSPGGASEWRPQSPRSTRPRRCLSRSLQPWRGAGPPWCPLP